MSLFKNLFKRKSKDVVETIDIPKEEVNRADIERNSFISDKGPLRVVKLCSLETGESIELDLNDEDALDEFNSDCERLGTVIYNEGMVPLG